MALKGRYICRNPAKYIGNANKIIFRSSWEINVMRYFDLSTGVKRWSSEPFHIMYISPKDRQPHRYFPDFYVEYIHKDGSIKKEIVEVKPLHETVDSAAKTDRDKFALIVNKAKWAAANIFAKAHGMTFRVITEMSIFKTPPKYKTPKKIKPKIRAKGPKRPK
jgi:hypothetical protein